MSKIWLGGAVLAGIVTVFLGLLVIVWAAIPSAHGQVVRLSAGATLDDLPTYDTLNEAAVYGAKRLYLCSHVYECGGVIAQRPDGKFVVGPLVSSYAGDHVNFGRGAPIGYKVLATIHSHPCLADSHEPDFFSPQDMIDVITHKEAGYMLNQCTGEVHLLTPENIHLQQPSEGDIYIPKGEIIGKIPVSGASVEPNVGFQD